jgi:hypothetical protein
MSFYVKFGDGNKNTDGFGLEGHSSASEIVTFMRKIRDKSLVSWKGEGGLYIEVTVDPKNPHPLHMNIEFSLIDGKQYFYATSYDEAKDRVTSTFEPRNREIDPNNYFYFNTVQTPINMASLVDFETITKIVLHFVETGEVPVEHMD